MTITITNAIYSFVFFCCIILNLHKMTAFDDFLYFVKYIFPIAILAFGLIGNTLGVLVLYNKDLKNIGPRNTYIFLFICDSLYFYRFSDL